MALAAGTSLSSLPQSSMGRLEVMSVEGFSYRRKGLEWTAGSYNIRAKMRLIVPLLFLSLLAGMIAQSANSPYGEWEWRGSGHAGAIIATLEITSRAAVMEVRSGNQEITAKGKAVASKSKRFPGSWELQLAITEWRRTGRDVRKPGQKFTMMVSPTSKNVLAYDRMVPWPENKHGQVFGLNDGVGGVIDFKRVVESPDATPESRALRFIWDYTGGIPHNGEMGCVTWLRQYKYATPEFASRLEAYLVKAYEKDPVLGPGADPILAAQDYPQTFFVKSKKVSKDKATVVLTGEDGFPDALKVALVKRDGVWLVDGSGDVLPR